MLTNKQDIEKWLEQYDIKNYNIFENKNNDGYIVNVNDDVNLSNKDLKAIEVQFGIVRGGFSCDHNKLTSLLGCPEKLRYTFNCSYNQLTSLNGSPIEIEGGDFWCHNNKLISLEGCTQKIKGIFDCSFNQLSLLNYLPEKVDTFYCHDNTDLGQLQNMKNLEEIKKIQKILTFNKRLNNLIPIKSIIEKKVKI